MPRHRIPEVLPFGVRRPPARENRKLSNLELLFVALVVLAVIYLASLGARTDSWMKAAQAEFQARTLLAQPRRRHLAGVRTAPLAGKPSGFLKFAGGLDLAVLAGPVTCPTCDPVHADGQFNVERISAPILTAAISPAPDRVLDGAPAAAAAETTTAAGKLPDTIQELTDKGPPQVEIAVATVESEPEPPLPPVGNAMLLSKKALHAHAPHRHVATKQRHGKARAHPRLTTTASVPKLYSPKKYAQVPRWAAKMFDSNWQNKAFAYQ